MQPSSFVAALFEDVFSPLGSQLCRILCRESLGVACSNAQMLEAIVVSTVDDIMRPLAIQLSVLLRKIDNRLREEEANFVGDGIIGQCAYYCSNQLFIRRLRGEDFADRQTRHKAARHISTFALHGLGCSADLTSAVIKSVFGS